MPAKKGKNKTGKKKKQGKRKRRRDTRSRVHDLGFRFEGLGKGQKSERVSGSGKV